MCRLDVIMSIVKRFVGSIPVSMRLELMTRKVVEYVTTAIDEFDGRCRRSVLVRSFFVILVYFFGFSVAERAIFYW